MYRPIILLMNFIHPPSPHILPLSPPPPSPPSPLQFVVPSLAAWGLRRTLSTLQLSASGQHRVAADVEAIFRR